MAVTQGAYKGTQCKNKIRQFKEIKGGSRDYLLSESCFVSDLDLRILNSLIIFRNVQVTEAIPNRTLSARSQSIAVIPRNTPVFT